MSTFGSRLLFAWSGCFIAFCVAPIFGQGIIEAVPEPCPATGTPVNAQYEYLNLATVRGIADFRPSGAGTTDHLFQGWWYYRVAGFGNESPFPWVPAPASQSYTSGSAGVPHGIVAISETLVGGFLFDSEQRLILRDFSGAGQSAYYTDSMTITNVDVFPLIIDVFHYLDVDVLGSGTGDTAVAAPSLDLITIMDSGDIIEYRACNPSCYRIDTFPAIRDDLDDPLTDDFLCTPPPGLQLGPTDITAGYQWSLTIPPGGSATVCANVAFNMAAPTPECCQTFFRCDCDGDGFLNCLADAIYCLEWLFGLPMACAPPCHEAADADRSGGVTLGDILYCLDHCFGPGPPPSAPYPACGIDPDFPGTLGCGPTGC